MALRSLTLPLPAVIPPLPTPSSSSPPSPYLSFWCSFRQNQYKRYPGCSTTLRPKPLTFLNRQTQSHVVRMAPEEEKLTRRSPLEFPIEWERPKPARRPDIFPQFSPMKTPLPPPLPADPPEEDEEEEEKKEEEEGDEDPDKETPEDPGQQ
ncbi:formin-binding protein 4 [Pyrus x bretschneideri]|uniref:formin-binding protein 4 n=1 Tax=Pyrus x bretschneideri TaxID=225117 RepID=UPI00202E36A5|nr:formin-binding protein 4 [Pyrus x bretschneideri]